MGRPRLCRRSSRCGASMPPGVDIARWRDAVDQTRAMLMTVTGSNLLDIPDMVELRVELTAARPSGLQAPCASRRRAGRDLERGRRPRRILVQGQPIAFGRSPSSPANLADLWRDTGCAGDQPAAGARTGRRRPGHTGATPSIRPAHCCSPSTDSNLLSVRDMQQASDRSRRACRAGERPPRDGPGRAGRDLERGRRDPVSIARDRRSRTGRSSIRAQDPGPHRR